MAEAEGKQFSFEGTDQIRADYLEVFEFHDPHLLIETKTSEFSCVCPFSGLPDFADLIIEYYPDGHRCVELKSLKYYLITYRNVGIYQEAATSRIYNDLKMTLKTERLKVTTLYNTRGGFDTTCSKGDLEPKNN
ncbi:MAG: NADPH-dependent 7-cyano-7-deazaguanine reductase [bacterium]|nr:MAG: NADPH-dependent 7-cyano-7-deazaguanine reductase [bacterium]